MLRQYGTVDIGAVEHQPPGVPIAYGDAFDVEQDGSITFDASDLLSNDLSTDGSPLSVQILAEVQHGNLVDNGDGTFTYTPEAGFWSVDSLSYQAVNETAAGGPVASNIVEVVFSAISPQSVVVTTADDEQDGNLSPDDISLREALYDLSASQIQFSAALAGQKIVLDETINLAKVYIRGLGARLAIDGNDQCRVFNVGQGDTTLSQLTITSGYASYELNDGGGIHNNGNLTVLDTIFSGNLAYRNGGAIYNAGKLTVDNSLFTDNTAAMDSYIDYSGGCGIYSSGTLYVTGSTFSENLAERGYGGGINIASGVASIADSTIANNSAYYGGGVSNNGDLVIENTIITNNDVESKGGGVYNHNSGTITLADSSITGNNAQSTQVFSSDDLGGGIYNYHGTVTLTNALVENNTARNDGGIHNDHGTLVIMSSSITGNLAEGGAGVENSLGTMEIVNSIIARNDGYGVRNYGNAGLAELSITNCTIVDNTDYGITSVKSSPFSHYSASTVGIDNTIVARNGDEHGFDLNGPFSGSHNLIGNGANQSLLVDGVDGNQVGESFAVIDPMLSIWGPMSENQWGYLLLPGSPAVNAGDNVLAVDNDAQPLTEDIHGNARIQEGTIDIGAIEGTNPGPPGVVYVVTSLDNTIADDGILTFIEALKAASGNQPVGDAAAGSFTQLDTIRFTARLSGTTFVDQKLTLSDDLQIEGPGDDLLVLNAIEGLFTIQSSATVILSGMTITGASDQTDRAIYSEGNLAVIGVTFLENRGGAIRSDGSGVLNVVNSAFHGNSTLKLGSNDSHGGAIYFGNSSTLNVANSTFVGNSTSRYGYGGAIHGFGSLTIDSSTFVCNSSKFSGLGIYGPGSMTISNTILFQSTLDTSYLLPSDNLIGVDPHFVRMPYDGGDGWEELGNNDYGDLRLTVQSPAINHGSNDLLPPDLYDLDRDSDQDELLPIDFDGNARVFGSVVDYGAFEFQEDIAPGREATSLVVTTADDIVDLYDDKISLREALYYLEKDALDTTITFASSLDGATIDLSGEPIWIDKAVKIDASPLCSLIIDAGGESGVFVVRTTFDAEVEFDGLKITGGYSRNGAGINKASAHLTLKNCTFSENSTPYDGGGIFSYNGDMTVMNSTFSYNDAYKGGGIYFHNGTLAVMNSTLFDNTVDYGGGGIFSDSATTEIHNTIIAGNAAPSGSDLRTQYGSLSGSYNLLGYGTGQTALVDGVDGNQVGTLELPIYPRLDENGSPLPDSPAIDAGNNDLIPSGITTDCAGNTRILNGTVDIGAYEFDLTRLLPGDANLDGRVDGSDVTILAGNWQAGVIDETNATWSMGDFNGDGKVDGSDVTILAGNWQAGVTPSMPGDANLDGRVDGSDVTILASNWQVGVSDGQTATWSMGDFNADGKVDGSDVTILGRKLASRREFGCRNNLDS